MAEQFVQLAEQRTDGADFVERFIQKAAPDVMATQSGESGIHRVKAQELLIMDTAFLKTFLTDQVLKDVGASMLRFTGYQNLAQAVVKPYSQPVGFGTPPG